MYQQEAEKIPDIIYPYAYLRNITKILKKNTNTHTQNTTTTTTTTTSQNKNYRLLFI